MSHPQKWPKRFAPLTPEQESILNDFVKQWLEVLPRRYSAIERFNHGYPVWTWAEQRSSHATKPVRTLEVGAGLGAHIGYEDLSHQDYHALEMRENVLEVLKSRFPMVHAVLGSIEERRPFADGYFDRVVIVHVLEHLCNLPAARDEFRRLPSPPESCQSRWHVKAAWPTHSPGESPLSAFLKRPIAAHTGGSSSASM
jgi:SAM-dependent methyltransferase